jgi:hypothetical protein
LRSRNKQAKIAKASHLFSCSAIPHDANLFGKKERPMTDPHKARSVTRGISYSIFTILFLSMCCALSAQNEQHHIRNVVLVHGAWADGSGWKGIYDILLKDGYNVSIVQEPETSFKEDVAATKRILALQMDRASLSRIAMAEL